MHQGRRGREAGSKLTMGLGGEGRDRREREGESSGRNEEGR